MDKTSRARGRGGAGLAMLLAGAWLSGSVACGSKGAADTPGASDRPAEAGPRSEPATQPLPPWNPPRFAERKAERDGMVRVISRHGMKDPNVLKAMAAVPRHEFVPKSYQSVAYRDGPLPIGHSQTISQPYIVAEMTRLLRLDKGARVLEIGTGSGYQAAVLTEQTRHVYTIEIVKPLADAAARRLKRLGYHVVKTKHADGYHGWPEKGPFDAIIVTCAAGQVPPPLLKQLKAGGTMVIPVGRPFGLQHLIVITKDKAGKLRSRSRMAVRFVPLRRTDISKGG